MAADLISQPQDPGSTLEIPQRVQVPRDPFAPREDLINAMITQESGGKAGAEGKAGEEGLMQILPATAALYGVDPKQLLDPKVNRATGTRYFSDLLKRYKGNEFLALVAYNSGPGRVDKGQLLPQSVKYATRILDRAKGAGAGQIPQIRTQSQFVKDQPPPSMLQRIGRSLEGALEGTAYAEEPPAPPPGYGAPVRMAGAAPSPSVQSGAPVAQPPTPPKGFGAPQPFNPSQFKMGMSIGTTGPRFTLQQQTPTTQERQQLDSASIALNQLMDAAKFYDTKVKPKESQFTGSMMTPEGWRGFMQGPEYTHSRYASMFGLHADPDIKAFFNKIGPLQAELLRGYIGGRVGIAMAQYLGPHIPNPQTDDLPTIREKVEGMQRNLPIIMQTIKDLSQRGADEDTIANTIANMPYQGGGATSPTQTAPSGGSAIPPPPPGFE